MDQDASIDALVNNIMASLTPEFEVLPDQLEDSLKESMLSGIHAGALDLQITDADLLADANEEAAAWARNRAAELVGMKYNDDGELVPNPDAKWAITGTTRDEIRRIVAEGFEDTAATAESIAADIDAAGIFSPERAAMIAGTEIAHAQTAGNISIWQDSGMVSKINVLLSNAEGVCDECSDIADGGPYELDDIADEYPFHPNCRCTLTVVIDEAGNDEL
jgi:hypothetical protein